MRVWLVVKSYKPDRPSPKSNAEIGRELYMSIATVKAHVSRLLEKLKFNNRVQIALLAHDAGEA